MTDFTIEKVISSVLVLDTFSEASPYSIFGIFLCITFGSCFLWNAITENKCPSSVTSKQMVLPLTFGMLVAMSFLFTLPAIVVLSVPLVWISYKSYKAQIPELYENNKKGIVSHWTFRMEKQRKENHGKLPEGMTLPPIEELYIPLSRFIWTAVCADMIRLIVFLIFKA